MHKASKILFIALLAAQGSFASQVFDLNTLDPEYKETLVKQLAQYFYPTVFIPQSIQAEIEETRQLFYQEVMENNKSVDELVTYDQLKGAFFSAVWLDGPKNTKLVKDIISLMIDLGVDINTTTNTNKENILMLACQLNDKIVPFLLNKGADIKYINKDNQTALHYAFYNRSHNCDKTIVPKLVSLLINAGVNVNHQDTLTCACWYAPEAGSYLLAAGCNIDVVNVDDLTPLQILCYNPRNKFDAIVCLLNAGADPKVRNKNGLTPLQTVINDCPKLVPHLINAGANANRSHYVLGTLLHKACAHHPELIPDLLRGGANPNFINKDDWKPLDIFDGFQYDNPDYQNLRDLLVNAMNNDYDKQIEEHYSQ